MGNTDSLLPRLPGLDGLRALSILAVIVFHLSILGSIPSTGWVRSLANRGEFGVSVFFVLSGYLITWLLLREEQAYGRISLQRFYFRRSLRILPPAYIYLICIGVLAMFQIVARPTAIVPAALFARNYTGQTPDITGHFWSLAVEEQFYLVWPALFVLAPQKLRLHVVFSLVVLCTAWKAMNFSGLFGPIDLVNRWRFDLVFDRLAIGGCLAILRNDYPQAMRRGLLQRGYVVVGAVVMIAGFLSPAVHRGHWLLQTLLYPIACTMVALIINVVVEGHRYTVKLLDNPLMTWMGRLSYSLYLWQQLFCLAPPGNGIYGRFPWNLIFTVLTASASYYLIELPSLRIRATIERAWKIRRETATPPDASTVTAGN